MGRERGVPNGEDAFVHSDKHDVHAGLNLMKHRITEPIILVHSRGWPAQKQPQDIIKVRESK